MATEKASHTPGPWRPDLAKHTPGNWVVHEKVGDRIDLTVAEISGRDGGTLVAEIRGATRIGGIIHAENMANARLIAAAPDLLETLQAIATHAKAIEATWVEHAALFAIRKATGDE